MDGPMMAFRYRFRSGRALVAASSLLLFGLTVSAWAEPPSWWNNPRRHDASHLYFKAKGESATSEQAARMDALDGVRRQVSDYIEASGEGAGRFELRGIESYGEASERLPIGRWVVYMLGRYPVSEYEKIRGRIESAEALGNHWNLAQSELNRGEYSKAEARMKSIVAGFDQALSPGFALENVKRSLAGLYLKQTPPAVLEARKWIQDVRKSTSEPGWRRQAEDMERNLPPISLYDAFGAGKVGLFCCVRDAQPVRASSELLVEAAARFSSAGVETVRLVPTDIDQAALLFDAGSAGPLLLAAQAAGAETALAILLTIDPAKTGRKIEVFDGVQMDALDATLYYYVIRVADGQILCSDKTQGISITGAKSFLNTVFTHRNHLPKYAPDIAERKMVAPQMDGER